VRPTFSVVFSACESDDFIALMAVECDECDSNFIISQEYLTGEVSARGEVGEQGYFRVALRLPRLRALT
jgi:hypothetical protein